MRCMLNLFARSRSRAYDTDEYEPTAELLLLKVEVIP